MTKQETRGGKREGSGRPKSAPTKTLSYRVPLKLAAKIDKEIRKIITNMKALIFLFLMCCIASLCSCSKSWEDIEIMPAAKKVFILSKRFTNPPSLNQDKTWKPYKIITEEIKGVDWQGYYGVKADTLISTCSIDKRDSLFKIEIRTFEIR